MRTYLLGIAVLPLLVCLSAMTVASQVVVSGLPGEDTDSSPRDDDGNIIGPETDGEFQSIGKAVEFLNLGGGGTMLINSSVPVGGVAQTSVPLTVTGANASQAIDGEINVINTTIVLQNIQFVAAGQGRSGIFLDSSQLTAENVVFNKRGIAVLGEGESTITIRDCEFIDSQANGLTGFGNSMTVDVQNTTFRDFTGGNKGLAIQPLSGVADVTVKNCTFTNGLLAIDDRRTQGEALYENIVIENMSRIGLNIEWDGQAGPLQEVSTVVRNVKISNCAYQGVHIHGYKNVILDNVEATGCGFTPFFDQDGAGIGTHFGCDGIVIEDCKANNNAGNGFHFELDRNITLRNCEALDNNLNGIRFNQCQDVEVAQGCWLSGNNFYGVFIDRTNEWEIHNSTIGLNKEQTGKKENISGGIALNKPGSGEIGSVVDPLRGNTIAGNFSADILFLEFDPNMSPEIEIGSNNIGTDGQGGILPDHNDVPAIRIVANLPFPRDLKLQIGGANPSIANPNSTDNGVGNIISSSIAGIQVSNEAGGVQGGQLLIQGNRIGAPAQGTVDQLSLRGIDIENSPFDRVNIGGDNPSLGNRIINSIEDHIRISASLNLTPDLRGGAVISHNVIGPDEFLESSPYSTNGITINDEAGDGSVGEFSFWNNTIQNNPGYGIQLINIKEKPVLIKRNSIWGNGKKGIFADEDSEVPAVSLDRVPRPGQAANIITGSADPAARIEIFVDPVISDKPAYWGQGKTFVSEITADATGEFQIDLNTITEDGILTVTATDENDSTSEFSPIASHAITQVVRDDGRWLVARKPTVLRVYADAGLRGSNIDVSGSIEINELNSIVPNPDPFQARAMGTVLNLNDRRNARNSMNFYDENPDAGTRKYELTITQGGHERHKVELGEYNYQTIRPFTMAAIQVYAPNRTNPNQFHAPNMREFQKGLKYFADIYPIDPEPFISNMRTLTPIVLFQAPHTDARHRAMANQAEAIRCKARPFIRYAAVVAAWETFFEPPGSPWILYGFTFPNIPTVIHLLDAVKTGTTRHLGNTLAHEVGHTVPFSLGDTYSGGSLSSLNPRIAAHSDDGGNHVLHEHYAFSPTGTYSRQNPLVPQAVFSDSASGSYAYDFMSNQVRAWSDITSYRFLFGSLGGNVGGTAQVEEPDTTPEPLIIVRGEISQSGDSSFFPLDFMTETLDRLPLEPTPDSFQIVLLDENGAELDSQILPPASVAATKERLGETVNGEAFGEYVMIDPMPFTATLRDVTGGARIELRQGDTVLASVDKSPNAPVVGAVTGLEQGVISENFNIAWTATDADPGQSEALWFDVMYTPDDGETWLPIGVDLFNTYEFTVMPAFLPAALSPGAGRIWVRASDGWNQSDSDQTPIELENQPPTAEISSPLSGASFAEDLPINLFGGSYDREDGFLGGENVVWTLVESDETLGTGLTLLVSLPVGTHTIRLTVTDSSGLQATDEVSIVVTEVDDGGTQIKQWRILD